MIVATPAKVLAYYFQSIGVGVFSSSTTAVWPLGWSKIPDNDPRNRIVIFDVGKIPLPAYQRTGETPQMPLVQIRIRAAEVEYDKGWNKGETIVGQNQILDQLYNAMVTIPLLTGGGNETVKIKSARVYLPLTSIGQTGDKKDWHFVTSVRLHLEGV